MSASERYISVKELAEQIGMDRSHCRRFIKKLGIEPEKRRLAEAGNQLSLTVTETEAAIVRNKRSEKGFQNPDKPVQSGVGWFYVIQLVPELDPNRIKFGFSESVDQRLEQHRTSAPTASVVKAWPCKRSWESTVIDFLASIRCRLILNEVYECDSLGEIIGKGDELFALLPDPNSRPLISDASPINLEQCDE